MDRFGADHVRELSAREFAAAMGEENIRSPTSGSRRRRRNEGQRVEAFVAYVGGSAHDRRLGAAFPTKISRPLVLPALRGLLLAYEASALPDERFSQTVARLGTKPLSAALEATLSGPTRRLEGK